MSDITASRAVRLSDIMTPEDEGRGMRGLCDKCMNHQAFMLLCDPPIIKHTCKAGAKPDHQKAVATEGKSCHWFCEKNTTVREVWE